MSCVLGHVRLFATPWSVACQAPLSMAFFKPEYWSGLSFPSPGDLPDPGLLHCRQTPYRLSYQGSSLSYNIYSFHKFHLNLPLSIFFFTKIMVVTNYTVIEHWFYMYTCDTYYIQYISQNSQIWELFWNTWIFFKICLQYPGIYMFYFNFYNYSFGTKA